MTLAFTNDARALTEDATFELAPMMAGWIFRDFDVAARLGIDS